MTPTTLRELELGGDIIDYEGELRPHGVKKIEKLISKKLDSLKSEIVGKLQAKKMQYELPMNQPEHQILHIQNNTIDEAIKIVKEI